jgi:hypothetical protein
METIRTTVSLVFWTETLEESTAIVQDVTAALPEPDQAGVLTTVEIKPAGRP